MGFIYVIKNKINDKVYIGQTKYTIEKRWKEHLYNVEKRNQLIYMAMRKYGIENFYIEKLEEVANDVLDKNEILYIKKFNSIFPNGYNLTTGSSKFGNDNPMYHEEIRLKVSSHFIGNKNPAKRPEVREKISKSRIGKKASLEARKKMSENNSRYWKGKKLPEETKKKISKNHGMRGKFGCLNPNAKSVNMINKNTNQIVKTFDSINSAVRWLKSEFDLKYCNGSNITNVCHDRQKTAYGFIWRFN